jgi:hypothetical protein
MPEKKMNMSEDQIKARIAELFSEAAKRNSCYEAVVQSQFNAAMRSAFGDNETQDAATSYAFAHARSSYSYKSVEEEREAEKEDWKNGICQHGLDVQTCPCGCFEGDDDDYFDDSDPDENLMDDEQKLALWL